MEKIHFCFLPKLLFTDFLFFSTALYELLQIKIWFLRFNYLMMVLQRCNLFPLGDIALVNSMKEVKSLPKHISKEELLMIAENWKPYRTVAAFILWHSYLSRRKRKY